ncbi:BrnT family toxin [Cupriavidus sp. NPDC089707]|uniref:BrnT family toxin n=1 Tax=Cupriavidus sp. NPDC089707 TaxID=3363963 RepID=UPI00382C4F17
MEISYDAAKNARNVAERGLSFDQVRDFDFHSARIAIDERRDYGEPRYVAVGYLGERLHVLCFTETSTGIRVISFRKANQREVYSYGKTRPTD